MTDITEIKRVLAQNVQAVAEHLLPSGIKDGAEWRVGGIDGSTGKSLGIHLTGVKAGIWQEFNGGQGGDLLDLWCAVRNIPLSDAMQEAKHFLGFTDHMPAHPKRKEYVRPEKPKCQRPAGTVLDYLMGERAIPQDVLTKYKVGEQGDNIIFPFLLPDGELAMAKARKAADGEKPKPTSAGCEPVLFGWQAIEPNERSLIITEGEIDALSWAAYGYPAMSVPFGGGGGEKQAWIESDFERLERFENIYVATDMDEPGEKAAEEICARLGRHRCLRVTMPLKDANECLKSGIRPEVMAACILEAKPYIPEGLRRASEFTLAVTELFWPKPGTHEGYSTPYEKLRGKLLFRPGEMTLWTGSSGSGKSQILSDCAVDWVRQGSRTCISSLEMKAAQSLKRMAKQAGNVDRPTENYITAIMQYLDGGLLFYERVGKEGIDGILEIFNYARSRFGCDQFVIDSLMRLGIASDDYNSQEQVVYEIVNWTIKHDVHVHLVAHARKGNKNDGVPETEDIKGAMEIGANAFNIMTVWRNRKNEEKLQSADPIEQQDAENSPGVVLNVAKQRNGDFEGKVGLWFNQSTYQYRSAHCDKHGRNYIQFSEVS